MTTNTVIVPTLEIQKIDGWKSNGLAIGKPAKIVRILKAIQIDLKAIQNPKYFVLFFMV
jgi:hypothetical protein